MVVCQYMLEPENKGIRRQIETGIVRERAAAREVRGIVRHP